MQASMATTPEYCSAGKAPLLDLVADDDPFRPPSSRLDIQRELGAERVTVVAHPQHEPQPDAEQPATSPKQSPSG